MSSHLLWIGALLLALTGACTPERSGRGPSNESPTTACQAGTKAACTCESGDTGKQTCVEDGSRYGVCNCTPNGCFPMAVSACTCEGGGEGTMQCRVDGSRFDACQCEPVTPCTPNSTEACTCTGGDSGTRMCRADGSGFNACQCDPELDCIPNSTEACTCTGGDSGTRQCRADGSGFQACRCDPTPICTPNASQPCDCPNDVSGIRLCAANGMQWGTCSCPLPACTPNETKTCSCGGGADGTKTCAANGLSWGGCESCVCPGGKAFVNGACVDVVDPDCALGEFKNTSGRCAWRGCAQDFRNGGTGRCVPNGECAIGYESAGGLFELECRHAGKCENGLVNNGVGACVPSGCAPNYLAICDDPTDYACRLLLGSGCTHRVGCLGGTILADAGAKMTAQVNKQVSLSGSRSLMGGGAVVKWVQKEPAPPSDGSDAINDSTQLVGAWFTPVEVRTYEIQLRISDKTGCESFDSVTVVVKN